MITGYSRRGGHSRQRSFARWGRPGAGIILISALALGGASPALAWGSVNQPQNNPPGCSGGFAGSSSPTGNVSAYVSTGRQGSTCRGTSPAIGAYVRYANNTAVIACRTTGEFCSARASSSQNAVGGTHKWGSAQFNS